MKSTRHRRSERGNVFFTLFGAVAIVGVLGAGIMATMRGPLSTMVNVNRRTQAEADMNIASKLVLLEATQGADSGDCDADGFVEPLEYKDPGSDPAPTGGGFLPDSVGSNKIDPWGTPYGYCAWDAGPDIDMDSCAGQRRLAGNGGPTDGTYTVIALVSAGPDQTFQTTCVGGASPDITKSSGSDDMWSTFSYETASAATGGLWSIKPLDPDTAIIDKNIEAQGALFGGAVSIADDPLARLTLGQGSMLLPTSIQLPDAACNAANSGLLRINIADDPNTVEICDDASDAGTGPFNWESVATGAAGLSLWQQNPLDLDEIYYSGGFVGVGLPDPEHPLDVSGTVHLSDDLLLEAAQSIIWDGATGDPAITENSGGLDITANTTQVSVLPAGVAVAGNTSIVGSGADDTTNALTIANSSGTPGFVFENDGEVGIGVADPNDRLDVSGSIDLTEHLKLDGVNFLTDNAAIDTILLGKNTGGATTTGISNTVIGSGSGTDLTSGTHNTILGMGAGATLADGMNNILIGANDATPVDVPAADTDNYLNIGNVLFGDLANGRIGIGTDTLTDTLEVNGTVDASGTIHSDSDITANGNMEADGDIIANDDVYASSEIFVDGTRFGPAAECLSTEKLNWDDATGWTCITDLQGGSGGGAPDLLDVLTEGSDAGALDADNFDQVGANEFCNADRTQCFDPEDIVSGATGSAISSLRDATADNVVNVGAWNQIWTYQLTGDEIGLVIGESAPSTGGTGPQFITAFVTQPGSTAIPLGIQNDGNNVSFYVGDTPSDPTPFVISNAGHVGVGTPAPFTGWNNTPTQGIHIQGADPGLGFFDTGGGGAERWVFVAATGGFHLINDTDNASRVFINNDGDVGINDGTPEDGTAGGGQNLRLDVGGAAGADYYCDSDGLNCFTPGSVAGTGIWERNGTVIRTRAPADYTTDDFVFGSPQLADAGNAAHDSRMFFDKSRAVFRAGTVTGTQWDELNTGLGSAGFGADNIASGSNSLVFGAANTASGANSFAGGNSSIANGTNSIALGSVARSSGEYSIAIGNETRAGSGTAGDGTGDYSMAIGLGNATGAIPQVTGDSSLGIFMGDRSGVTIAANNIMGLMGGRMIIDPTGAQTNISTGVEQLELDVEGSVGAVTYCDEDGNNCFTPDMVYNGSARLSSILAATAPNAILNAAHQQTWAWQLSGAGAGMLFGESAASTGGAFNQAIVYMSTLPGSTAIPLAVVNEGNGATFVVSDSPADATPFVIDAAGNVGIGTPGPTSPLTVAGLAEMQGNVLFNGGPNFDDNMMYLQSATAGAVDGSLGFHAAGVGSSGAVDGPYFLARGNDFSQFASQRGNVYFTAGNPAAAGVDEGSINFRTGNDQPRMIVTNVGEVGIGDQAPDDGTGGGGQNLLLDVEGPIGGSHYCDQDGLNCFTAASVFNGTARLSSLLAANANNSINNSAWNQVWNWQLTGAETAFTFGENAASTGGTSDQYILSAETLAASTAIPFRISNLGNGYSFVVHDQAADPSPFVITANGEVGIGTALPQSVLHLQNATPAITFFDTDAVISAANPAWRIRGQDIGNFIIQTTTNHSAFVDRLTINATGEVGIGDPTPDDGTVGGGQNLLVDVEGPLGASYYCDQNGLNCVAAGSLGATRLSQITAANADNTINNVANNQVWNWSLTGGETAFTFSEDTASTGGASQNQRIVDISVLSGSTAIPLSVINDGNARSFQVLDSAGDTTPFIIENNGDVGIGTAPIAALHIRRGSGTGYDTELMRLDAEDTNSGGSDGVSGYISFYNETETSGTLNEFVRIEGEAVDADNASRDGALIFHVAGPNAAAVTPVSEKMRITADGRVGINNAAPNDMVAVGPDTAGGDIGIGYGGALKFKTTAGADTSNLEITNIFTGTGTSNFLSIGSNTLTGGDASQHTGLVVRNGYANMLYNWPWESYQGYNVGASVGFGVWNPGNFSDALALYNTAAPQVGSGSGLAFSANRTTTGITEYARIGMVPTNIGNATYTGDLVFYTANAATADEKMRLTSSGNLLVGTTASTAGALLKVGGTGSIMVPVGDNSQRPTGAAGMIRYNSQYATNDGLEYYDAESGTWRQLVSGTVSNALSSITAAVAPNTILNGDHQQIWAWQKTTPGAGLILGESAASTGGTGDQTLLYMSTLPNSTASPLVIQNEGNAVSFIVADESGDTTPFAVDADGNVIVGGNNIFSDFTDQYSVLALHSAHDIRLRINGDSGGSGAVYVTNDATNVAAVGTGGGIYSGDDAVGGMGMDSNEFATGLNIAQWSDDVGVYINATSSSDHDALVRFNLGNASANFAMGVDDSDGDKFKIGTGPDLGVANIFTITPAGAVGVNTATPAGVLDVDASSGGANIYLRGYVVNHANLDWIGYYIGENATDRGHVVWRNGLNRMQIGTETYAHPLLIDGSVVALQSQSSGNVGIGTTTPNATLDVSRAAGTWPTIRLSAGDITQPDYTGSQSMGDLSTSNAFGQLRANRGGGNTVDTGGMVVQGMTEAGVNNWDPLALVGTHGGSAPTTAAVTIAGQRHDGVNNRTALAGTSPLLDIENGYDNGNILMRVLANGQIGMGDTTPDTGTVNNPQTLTLDVNGPIGGTYYCDENGNNCFTAATVLTGGTPRLSSIAAATADNTINNSAWNQVWNWQLTGAETAFTFGENTASTGGGANNQFILSANTLASSTAIPLRVSNAGNGISFRVDDAAADNTSFIIDNNGSVFIGGNTGLSDASIKLYGTATDTSPTGNGYPFYVENTYSPSGAASSKYVGGFFSYLTATTANAKAEMDGIISYADNYSGTFDALRGFYGFASNYGGGNGTNIMGAELNGYTASGTTTNVIGVNANALNNGATATNLIGGDFTTDNDQTNTNQIGVRITQTNSGTTTNRYAVKIEPLTGTPPTNNYGIYQEGGGINYFAGDILVGTTTATTGAPLKVGGTGSIMVPSGNNAQRPTGAAGMIRYNTDYVTNDRLEYFDAEAGVWTQLAAGTVSNALSSITAATADNTINNAAHNQVWNWQLTGDEIGINFGENAASTGGTTQAVALFSTLPGSTAAPAVVINQGNAPSFTVWDQNADTTPFMIDASGNVGVGAGAPARKLHVNGDALFGQNIPANLNWPAVSILDTGGGTLAIGSPTQGDWGGGFIHFGRDDGPNGGPAGTWNSLFSISGESFDVSSGDTSRYLNIRDEEAGVYRLTLDANGDWGFNASNPTYSISLGGTVARTIGMERNTGTNAGSDLTLLAGGAATGSTNANGGTLLLSSGIATGTGDSNITISNYRNGAVIPAANFLGDTGSVALTGSVASGTNSFAANTGNALGSSSASLGWATSAIGFASFAAGQNSEAGGNSSIALGNGAFSPGVNSVALGREVYAGGDNSVALGQYVAVGGYSAGGGLGNYSMAIGLGNNNASYPEVNGDNSLGIFMGSQDAVLTADNLMAVLGGRVLIDPTQPSTETNVSTGAQTLELDVEGEIGAIMYCDEDGNNCFTPAGVAAGGIWQNNAGVVRTVDAVAPWVSTDFVFGSPQLADAVGNDDDSRMYFDKSLSAFRVGWTDAAEWDAANVGQFSVGMGYKTTASGHNSTSIGYQSTAAGWASIAIGANNNAAADNSTAIGYGSTASGFGSVAIGVDHTASGDYSTALGEDSTAVGDHSFVQGEGSWADGNWSFASGSYSYVEDDYGIAMGNNAYSGGTNAVALGRFPSAEGDNSFATGNNAYATGNDSVAMGSFATAEGEDSFAVGDNSYAEGVSSVALGRAYVYGYGGYGFGLAQVGNGTGDATAPYTSAGDASVAFGLTDDAVTLTTRPRVTGLETFAIFMGDQDGVDVTANNLMALLGGRMVIDPDTTSAANTNVSTGAETLELDVTGDIGAVNYCDQDGNNCFTAASVAGGGSSGWTDGGTDVYVTTATDQVAIGLTDALVKTHIRDGAGTNGTVREILRLENEDTDSAGADGIGSALTFWNETETAGTFNQFARIVGQADDAANASRDGSLRFLTVGPDAASGDAAAERAFIDDDGLHVWGTGVQLLGYNVNKAGWLYIDNGGDSNVYLGADNNGDEAEITLNSAGNIIFGFDEGEAARITTAGYMRIFGNTATGNTALNVLEIGASDRDSAAADGLGANINFTFETETDGTSNDFGRIAVIATDAANNSRDSEMRFFTAGPNTTSGNASTERFRIDNNGVATIFTTSTSGTTANEGLRIRHENSSGVGGNGIGTYIRFAAESDSNTVVPETGRIESVMTDAANNTKDARMSFYTLGPNAINGTNTATEKMRINSAGLVGISTAATNMNADALLKLSSDDATDTVTEMLSLNYSSATPGLAPNMTTWRTKGVDMATPANVASADALFTLTTHGYYTGGAGGGFANVGAVMGAYVDGTPGANDMPSRWEFFTSPDGSITPVSRMMIKNNGNIGIGNFASDTVDSALHLVGTGSYLRLDDTAGSEAGCIRFDDTTTNQLQFSNDCSTAWTALGGAGAAAGANTQVQYNNAGAFGASASFTYDDAAKVLTVSNNSGEAFVNIVSASNTASFEPQNILGRARGTIASPTVVQANDLLASWVGMGYTGSGYQTAGFINVRADGGAGLNDMPGAIDFYTSPDGSASPVNRMTINNAGNVGIGTSTPQAKLDVFGAEGTADAVFILGDALNAAAAAMIYHSATTLPDTNNTLQIGNFYNNSSTDGNIQFYTGGGDNSEADEAILAMESREGAGLGIYDNTPEARFEINMTDPWGTNATPGIMVSSNAAGDGDMFIVDEAGLVGIGINNPVSEIHLAGTGSEMRFDDTPGNQAGCIRYDDTTTNTLQFSHDCATNWTSFVGASGGTALSALTAAAADNTIANAAWNQTWNWQLTGAETGLKLGESTASTGGSNNQNIVSVEALAASTATPLLINNLGDGRSFQVNDSAADATPFIIDENGKVLVGATSASDPSNAVYVYAEDTGTASARSEAISTYMHYTPSGAAPTRQVSGVETYIDATGGNAKGTVRGTFSLAENYGGSFTRLKGVEAFVGNYAGGSGTDMYALDTYAYADNGTLTNVAAVNALTLMDASATNTNQIGVWVKQESYGTTTNRYGVKIDNYVGTVTNDFGIYQEGGERNYFADPVGIGHTAAPDELLSVGGNIELVNGGSTITTDSTELVLEQTGDALGGSRLRLQNRNGLNGALFENPDLDLVDFGFLTSLNKEVNVRIEGRGGAHSLLGNETEAEFQVMDPDSASTDWRGDPQALGDYWMRVGKYRASIDTQYMGVGIEYADVRLHVDGTLMIGDGGETCSGGNFAGALRYTAGTLELCDGTAWTALGGSSATAAAPDRSIQFNNGGAFAGSASFAYTAGGRLTLVAANTNIFIQGGVESTQGSNNVAMGANALDSLSVTCVGVTDCDHNTAVGDNALTNNTSGHYNTAVGSYALGGTTTGIRNTAMGRSTMGQNSTGTHNVAMGYDAMFYNNGNYNVALGTEAGLGTGLSAYSNTTLVGGRAGFSMQTGADGNTLIGYQAGDAITTGANNIVIGNNVDAPSATGSNQLNIGDTIYGDLSTDRIGIGDFSGGDTIDSALHLVGTNSYIRLDDTAGNEAGCIRFDDTTNNRLEFSNDCSTNWTPFGGGGGAIDDLTDAETDYTTANNMFLGQGVGATVTTGTNNTALGDDSMQDLTTGYWNAAFGREALANVTEGNSNVAVGGLSLFQLTEGYGNTAVGQNTLLSVTTSYGNTAVGAGALQNTTANFNTAFGDSALTSATTGGANVGLGSSALGAVDTGWGNIGIGNAAGDNITSGTQNIMIGFDVDAASATGDEQLNIGNTIYGDLSTDRIGIGAAPSMPGYGLDVQHAAIFRGEIDETSSEAGLHAGYGPTGDTPRILFANGTPSENWQIDNENGDFRWFVPSRTIMSLIQGSTYELVMDGHIQMSGAGHVLSFDSGSGEGCITYDVSDSRLEFSNDCSTNWSPLGGGAGSTAINDLTDAVANYTATNMFFGTGVGATVNTGWNNTVIGMDALTALNDGFSNVGLGNEVFTDLTDGSDNVAVGALALGNLTTGTGNIAIGTWAGHDIVGASDSVAIGYEALRTNVAKSSYTAVGTRALKYAYDDAGPDQAYSTAIGFEALMGSATPGNNTANANTGVGYQALTSATSGNWNTAVGVSALASNTSAHYNTAVGNSAMASNLTGVRNVALGAQALALNETGGSNTAIGYRALEGNIAGADNVALGYRALLQTTGSGNIAIGYQTGDDASFTGSSNILIGYDVAVPNLAGNNQMNIGNTLYGNLATGYIGIGTSTPTAILHIAGDNRDVRHYSHSSGDAGFGPDYEFHRSGGTAGSQSIVGNNWKLGGLRFTGYDGSAYQTAASIYGYVDATPGAGDVPSRLVFNTTPDGSSTETERMRINNAGNIGIGDFSSDSIDSKLHIVGSGTEIRLDDVAGTEAGCIRYNDTSNRIEFSHDCSIGSPVFTTLGTTSSLSGLTAATAANTIDNLNFAQTWNWSTLSTQTALLTNANAITSGKVLDIASSSTAFTGQLVDLNLSGNNAANTGSVLRVAVNGANTTGTPLMVTNLGSGFSMRVNDQTGDTDPSPFVIDAAGNVGIQMTNPSVALDVTGDIEYTGTITDVSDIRLKDNVHPLSDRGSMMAKLGLINTYSFTMKDDKNGQVEFGVMAQEIEKVFPELVRTADDEMGTKSVNYVGLIAPMIEAGKELEAQNKAMKAELDALRAQQDEMKQAMNEITEDLKGLKVHTGYGISKAQMSLLMLLASLGTLSVVALARGRFRKQRQRKD